MVKMVYFSQLRVHFSFQTAQSNFHNQKLFEETASSSLLRSSYNQRQEQRYLLQSQLEQELLQNQIHQRYLEHRLSVTQQHRNDYEQLPPHSTFTKSQLKHQQYNPHQYTLDNRALTAQQAAHHSDLNNTSDRLGKQINFNLNNVNHYYNNTKAIADERSTAVHLPSIPKSIGYNTCNNNTIAQTKPYHNNNCSGKKYDNNRNNHDTYIEYLQKPIKMQGAEIIIEHSQLVLNGNANGNDNTNPTNPTHRPNHYTQVICIYSIYRIYPSPCIANAIDND